ncbi:NnrS [mine drainage metagenome]|uniref:NnrS n=1 Tax=mine drainage metagenome TaxID=410659 RepID=T0ZR31_9ZZZZ
MLTTGLVLPTRFAALDWHIHEMLFGFVPAAVAGFLLTAISQWTGRPPVSGGLLGLLFGLWLLGRIDVLTCDALPSGWPSRRILRSRSPSPRSSRVKSSALATGATIG